MKNIVIALVIIGAAGAGGGYYYYSKQQPDTSMTQSAASGETNPMLQWIPKDTLFFMGGLEPFPTLDAMKAMSIMGDNPVNQTDMDKLFDPVPSDPPGVNLVKTMIKDYMMNVSDLVAHFKAYGIADKGNSAMYTVGGIPVWRVQLGNKENFNSKIAQLEKDAGVQAVEKSLADVKYKSYALMPTTQKDLKVSLVVATVGEDAVMTLMINEDQGETLAMAFGTKKPQQSLADASILQGLIEKFGLHPGFLGFVNHEEIVRGITNKDDTQLGNLLTVIDKDNKLTKQLEEVRSPGCQQDLGKIAANWPRTVFGYTEFNVNNNPARVNSVMVLESKDGNYLSALKDLRGFIPAHSQKVSSDNIVSLALGIEVDSIVPFLNQEIMDISKKQYQCKVLMEMQGDIKKQNAAGLGMLTAMVQGLQGVSITLNKVEVDNQTQQPKLIDMMVTLTSKNPVGLMNMIAQLGLKNPEFKVPPDGQAVDLPVPLPIPNFSPKVAIKGAHVVAYNGPQAEAMANNMSNQASEANGMFAMNINYQKYFDLLNLAPLPPSAKKEFEFFSRQDMQVSIRFDVDSKGLSLYSDMVVNKQQDQAAVK